ncbi:MAG: acyl-CoA dehydrogenase family protein [Cyanophyceae cyanobacterium]
MLSPAIEAANSQLSNTQGASSTPLTAIAPFPWISNDRWLQSVEAAVKEVIAPQAAQLDRHPQVLREAFDWLGQQGWLHLRGGVNGQELSDLHMGQFREVLARYSGSLTFLQIQHQSAGAMVGSSKNLALREAVLPRLATGECALGIGYSHLRRSPSPVTARSVPGGYTLSGTMPWVTGWGCFEAFVGAAALEDGGSVFGLVPFGGEITQNDGRLSFGEPMELAAFSATQTVTVSFDDWFLADDQVLYRRSPQWISENDRKKVLSSSFFALGCTQGSLDLLQGYLSKRSEVAETLGETIEAIATELHQCRQVIYQHYRNDSPGGAEPLDYGAQLTWRGRAIALALHAANIAVITSGGAANYRDHPAQRLSREAIVFGVTGQTSAVLRTTLEAQGISTR